MTVSMVSSFMVKLTTIVSGLESPWDGGGGASGLGDSVEEPVVPKGAGVTSVAESITSWMNLELTRDI